MSAPPSPFAQAFRAHVIPAIRPRIGGYARRVIYGGCTFSEAIADLISQAHGATFLDKPTFDQFADWLCTQLTQQIVIAERVMEDIDRTEMAARRIMAKEAAHVFDELV